MFERNNKYLAVFIVLLIVLISIPISFASNNTDIAIGTDINQNEVSVSNDNLLGVDYYFDSSSNESGDGSQDNPYNELTIAKLKAGSTIHLANGEYTLNNGKSLSRITIIGQDAEKTVIRYTGTSSHGKFSIGVDNYLMLQNVTFIGFNFEVEGGIIQANNTIFKNGIASSTESSATDLVNSAVNSFGGSIYAYPLSNYANSYSPSVILEKCTFINNTAEYGGAVFVESGDLSITDCNFIDNHAYNFGGALSACSGASIRIKNSKFINDYSSNDAGGAVYLVLSYLSASNMSVINCSSTFGSGITSLNSTTALFNLTAVNNTAKYEGGVIYQMYGGITITDSNFINNSARNGGAVYVDDVSIFRLTDNNFEENKAVMVAGAVYSVMAGSATIKNNTYLRNKAKEYDDLYETDKLVVFFGNGNYTLILNNDTFNGTLPSYFDLRQLNLTTSVKDQQSGGNCWAFGSLAALESAILKASGMNLDLSEEHMKNIIELYSPYGWLMSTNDGGYPEMGIGYLTSWLGPVMEDIEKYDDYSMLSPVLDSFTHIQNIVFLPRNNYTDNNGIKEALMRYGAVQTGIYYDSTYFSTNKKSYYYYGSGTSNHAVCIVGWDDNYSKDNFLYKPAGNGAWIVKNSWNEDWGDDGYFYVSYYDTRLAEVGDREASYAFVFNDSERYDKIYQYDIIGKTDYLVTENKIVWVQNIFESTDNELLAAVSTYFRKTTDFELFIYVNDELVLTKNGTCNPGYTTINLGEYVAVSSGDIFKVVFKLTCESEVEFAISESVRATRLSYAPGISFFSEDGVNWTDLFDYEAETIVDNGHTYMSQVAAIKAFTILYELQPTIMLNVSNVYNCANIEAIIHDQYGNLLRSGEVILSIEGVNYTAKIENGIVSFTHTFNSIGKFVIEAFYKNARSNVTVDITKLNINLNSTIIVDKNNAIIIFTSPLEVNTTVNAQINNQTNIIEIIYGKGNLTLTDLDFGRYYVFASVSDDVYASELESEFNVTVSKTKLIADDLICFYTFENEYIIQLKDIYENPVVNRQVSFIIGGKAYAATTDIEGIAKVTLKLDNKTEIYRINVLFYGDEEYFASNATANVEVKSTIIFYNSNYLMNSNYNAVLLDKKGNPLTKTQVRVSIDGVDGWYVSDGSGVVSIKLNLKTGNHAIVVYNPETGEKLSQNISLVSRIMENKNMNVYYQSGSVYKIRVYGNNATPAGANEAVKIVAGKKTYTIRTNANGYASFNLNNLAPGTYTLKASYGSVTVSNKIVVKPVLTASNISKKKAKTIKFSAKLVNTKGKPLKGKKITFKLKGKTYSAKTNAKGIATISIKNLAVGKYTVTTKYSKSTIKNTIRIKK